MSTHPAGATVEQRYPGPSHDEARRLAGPQVRAFQAAGWTIADEAWMPATAIPGAGGMMVVTYLAARDTEVPGLQADPRTAEPRVSSRPTTVTIRIAIILVIVVIVMILFAWFINQTVGLGGPSQVGLVAPPARA